MKKFILIITCSLLTGITLAGNDKPNPDELPSNEDQNIQINNNDRLNSKTQELLKPNDIIVTVASHPYPGMPPSFFYPADDSQSQEYFSDSFRYKTVGIISAVGTEITNYKIGDVINIGKLNTNPPWRYLRGGGKGYIAYR